jgi:hypothetical protein
MKQRRSAMRVELKGVKDTRKAIRNFAPDLNKELNTELKRALSPIAKKAKGFVPLDSPMRGWAPRSFSETQFPHYSAATIKSGIGFSTKPGKTTKSGFTSNAQIFNKSAVGGIYETAGRANTEGQIWVGPKAGGTSKKVSRSVNPKAGAQFIANLPELSSSLMGRGRLIYRAWGQDQGKAYGAALKAIDTADRKFMALAKTTTLSKAA